MTGNIQRAIDSCAAHEGGTVCFMAGIYKTGTLNLKSHVTLDFEEGTVLMGSKDISDYDVQADALISGRDLSGVAITGNGTIDGNDCYNPNGEEGFRGPHCIRLRNCKNIRIDNITIVNSANWAINCRHCSEVRISDVKIRGGHDGLHTRFCNNFRVDGCDFRTGDDAFAGNDNRDFSISGCKINTSCNGFRMGCLNMTVKNCHFWGPGEYVHKIQNRHNMLSAFVHFSPPDENPKLHSGNWKIENITVENVDFFYLCNLNNGLWQTGQPVESLSFKNIQAAGLLGAFAITGDSSRLLKISVAKSSFSFREDDGQMPQSFEGRTIDSPAFVKVSRFGTALFEAVRFSQKNGCPVMHFTSGDSLKLKKVDFGTNTCKTPVIIDEVAEKSIFWVGRHQCFNDKQGND